LLITLRRIGWAGHTAEMCTNFNLKGTDHLKDLGINGRTILKLILQKYGMRMYTRTNWVQWQAVMNLIMNYRFHKSRRRGDLLSS
jgi:hypothetical protein